MYTDYLQRMAEINKDTKKSCYIKTLGCQLNENDSEKLQGILSQMGYTQAERMDKADLIVYNTCTVRENAEQKGFGHLGILKKLKEKKPGLIIALCGCMMQQKSNVDIVRTKYPHVDIVFGTHNIHALPKLLYKAAVENERAFDVWESEGEIVEGIPTERGGKVKAWVTIMYGCDNFCSYCIVPYVRGRERSRSMEEIMAEVTNLADLGYKEITLLGQNVNSYGHDTGIKDGFAKLLYKLNEIPGIERIRFMTSHPKDLSDELIKAMRDCTKVCKHLHLPLQSGSTRILEKMNRRYTKEQYLDKMQRVKESIPGIALTTDIIVGFPGETEEDFNETLEVLNEVNFDSAYTFIYSKRSGTPAAKHEEQVPADVTKERFGRLIELQNGISRQINEEYMDRTVEVLTEGRSKTNIEFMTGRTDGGKIVNFPGGEGLTGELVSVRIEKIQTWSLEGVLSK